MPELRETIQVAGEEGVLPPSISASSGADPFDASGGCLGPVDDAAG